MKITVVIRLYAFMFLITTGAVYAQQTPVHVGPRGHIHDDPANGIYVSPNGIL